MSVEIALQKRTEKNNDYLHFLLQFFPALVGYKPWVTYRLTTDLEEHFKNIDEAFLLLCYQVHELW